jgi:muramoyltetrapeptide carboxypeptidase LdcA involved in peptidoglycan recycling
MKDSIFDAIANDNILRAKLVIALGYSDSTIMRWAKDKQGNIINVMTMHILMEHLGIDDVLDLFDESLTNKRNGQ